MTKRKGIKHRLLRRLVYGVYLFVSVFLLLEIALRIYNPYSFRIKGEKIILPKSQRSTIVNNINPRLDSLIANTRNSIGLRGPEPPSDIKNYLSIITVGGSTTECRFLDDQLTWPHLLQEKLQAAYKKTWLNNAGLDGHSTFGHSILLNDYLLKLRPDVIIFLTGINDVENDGPSFHDKLNTKGAFPSFVHYLYNESEVINLAVNLARGAHAQRWNNTTQLYLPPGGKGYKILSAKEENERIQRQVKYLEGYRIRVGALADSCINNGILPIFLTQPTLYGKGTDSLTGSDLSTAMVGEEVNGALLWRILQMYNSEVIDLCAKKSVPCIDLADKMPKNGLYFYDQTHFTNEGAAKVAEILAPCLTEILKGRKIIVHQSHKSLQKKAT